MTSPSCRTCLTSQFQMSYMFPDVSDKVTVFLHESFDRFIWACLCALADDVVWMQGTLLYLWPRWDCLIACQWAAVSLLCDYSKKMTWISPSARWDWRRGWGGEGDIGGGIGLESWYSQVILNMFVHVCECVCPHCCQIQRLLTADDQLSPPHDTHKHKHKHTHTHLCFLHPNVLRDPWDLNVCAWNCVFMHISTDLFPSIYCSVIRPQSVCKTQ